MEDDRKARKEPSMNNLFSCAFTETGMMRVEHKVPIDYIHRVLAQQFLEAILEKLEITSFKDWNDPYAVRHVARVFIASPSEVFNHQKTKSGQEVVILDYRGFTRRMVVGLNERRVSMALMNPFTIVRGELDPSYMDTEIKYEKAVFEDRGHVNAMGERIFEWVPPPPVKSTKKPKKCPMVANLLDKINKHIPEESKPNE